jgi:hypothetical protein
MMKTKSLTRLSFPISYVTRQQNPAGEPFHEELIMLTHASCRRTHYASVCLNEVQSRIVCSDSLMYLRAP